MENAFEYNVFIHMRQKGKPYINDQIFYKSNYKENTVTEDDVGEMLLH
jgi:hypothetical protein